MTLRPTLRLCGALALSAAAAFAADSPVTFSKDVLSILQKNCQTCHRPGEVAPMSLLTYTTPALGPRRLRTPWSARKMPPWFADPVGHFRNERRSRARAEIATLSAWADNGAPEGDAKDAPAPMNSTRLESQARHGR